jgi:hypothetical protein
MPINFPDNPTVDESFTFGDRTWIWDGSTWNSAGLPALALSGGTLTGPLILDADPTQALGAATKEYVDSLAAGIIAKPSVQSASSVDVDATYNNGTAGVGATLTHNSNGVLVAQPGAATPVIGSGILIKSQTNKAENGRYVVQNMGSVSTPWVLRRCGLCDTADEIPGAYVFVQGGTFEGTGWIQIVADPATFVVGTDDINVFQFSGKGSYTAGNGLTLTGTEFAVDETIVATQTQLDARVGRTNGSVTTASTSQNVVRNITLSTANPTGGADGDVWLKYTA